MKTVLSVVGVALIALAIGLGVAHMDNRVEPVAQNTEHQVTTSGGMKVKLGKVSAELAQTNVVVGSGGGINVPITNTAKVVAELMAEAGVKDIDVIKGNLTVCLTSVVTWKSEANGLISSAILKECRNFTPGMFAATINTFAEDYTVKSVKLYETEYSFINKK